jgi:hypothetical protein
MDDLETANTKLAVRVKPLVWTPNTGNLSPAEMIAESVFGRFSYSMEPWNNGLFPAFIPGEDTRWMKSSEDARCAGEDAYVSRILAALSTEPAPPAPATEPVDRELSEAEKAEDEIYQIGYRDGFEEAVALIDRSTGGDGEYFASTIPGRGCPDPAAMIQKIVDRVSWDAHPTDAKLPADVRAMLKMKGMM